MTIYYISRAARESAVGESAARNAPHPVGAMNKQRQNEETKETKGRKSDGSRCGRYGRWKYGHPPPRISAVFSGYGEEERRSEKAGKDGKEEGRKRSLSKRRDVLRKIWKMEISTVAVIFGARRGRKKGRQKKRERRKRRKGEKKFGKTSRRPAEAREERKRPGGEEEEAQRDPDSRPSGI